MRGKAANGAGARSIVCAATASVFFCAAFAQTSDQIVAKAQSIVLESLKDPDSARFRNLQVYFVQDLGIYRVCGEVNAKNSYGGFAGFSPFFVNGNDLFMADGALSESNMNRLYMSNCVLVTPKR